MTYPDFIAEWQDDSETIECRTSGSTGTPKCILLPKIEMERSAWRTIKVFGLDSGSHLHSCISPDFIGGKMMAVRSLLCGGRLTWETPSSHPLEDWNGDRIDLLSVVPTQMKGILDSGMDMSGIRNILIGGSSIPHELRQRIAESGVSAWESYGMTETASHVALRRVTKEPASFHPLEGIMISLDEEARIVIDMKGWQRIVTNDIGEILPDGGFIVKGRRDNVIITGGKKVHPETVERILEPILGFELVISSLPDAKWGERVVMLTPPNINQSDQEIITICRENLSPERVPKEILRGALTYTENGKKVRNIAQNRIK